MVNNQGSENSDANSEKTDPNLNLTQEDLIGWLVGTVQGIQVTLNTIESKLEETPPWAIRLFDGMINAISRIEKLEAKVNQKEAFCKFHHPTNGSSL
jgi:hypothetical protein